MSKDEKEVIVQTAQKFVSHLPKEMDDELRSLIQRAKEGQDTTIEIIDLLSPIESIRHWMKEQIDLQSGEKRATRGQAGESSLTSLAGDPKVPASGKWICPESTCVHWIVVIQEGEDPPVCDMHNIEMIRESKRKG